MKTKTLDELAHLWVRLEQQQAVAREMLAKWRADQVDVERSVARMKELDALHLKRQRKLKAIKGVTP